MLRIARIDFDDTEKPKRVTGWTDLYESTWSEVPGGVWGLASDGTPTLPVELLGTDAWALTSGRVTSRSFELNDHPYLLSLIDAPHQENQALPARAFIARINDSGRGWQHLVNLPHIQTIINETVQEDKPAIMLGDFNVHESHYGNMNTMFNTFGAFDAYELLKKKPDMTIDACNNLLTPVFNQPGKGYKVGTCLPRRCPQEREHREEVIDKRCRIDDPVGYPLDVTPYRFDGQPHIFLLGDDCRTYIFRINDTLAQIVEP
jgi:hypothetical protein